MEKQSITLEIPKHVLARAASLASHLDCSPKTIMLAGIINIVEMGSSLNHITPNQEDFKFKLMLANFIQNQPTSLIGNAEKAQNVIAQNVITEYINDYKGYFSHYDMNSKNPWITLPKKAVSGRYTHNTNGVTLAMPWAKLSAYSMDRDIYKSILLDWAEGQGGKIDNVRLAPKSIVTRCLVLPMPKNENGYE